IVHTFCAFLEFCYIVCKDTITEKMLAELDDALCHFHQYHEVFWETGICTNGFSLPFQHSLVHYQAMICMFGAPNGLCTSITESKHIKAVKQPWWCSSKYKALGQILLTNQYLNKLAAARVDFEAHRMLSCPL
ncbi:hypothetical protein PAXRUDRAFT_104662, partial [Paxillus rubicundulus Ve08.2h10]